MKKNGALVLALLGALSLLVVLLCVQDEEVLAQARAQISSPQLVAVAGYNGQAGYELTQISPTQTQAALVYLPYASKGDHDSKVFVQNLGGRQAHVVLYFFDEGAPVTNRLGVIPPHGSLTFDQADEPGLPTDYQGGAVIEADQPILAVANVQPDDGSSLLSYDGVHSPTMEVALPAILRDFNDNTSIIWLQNASPTQADVTITFDPFLSGNPHVVNDTIPPFSSHVYPQAQMPELGAAFYGVALVQADQPVAAVVEVWNGAGPGANAYTGPAVEPLSLAGYAPRQQRVVDGWSSAVSLLNLDASTATITATYYSGAGASPGAEVATVPPGDLVSFATWLLPYLPDGFDGNVVASATGPLAGLANYWNVNAPGDNMASNPLVAPAQLGGLGRHPAPYQMHLPRVAHVVTAGLSTEFSIQNPDPAASAAVTVTFYHETGAADAVLTGTIAPHGVARYATGDVAGLGTNWQGAVTISATLPVAVEAMQWLQSTTTGCLVDSTADSGSGSLRQCLLTAIASDTITFDPAVFPPASPATISLTSGQLPDLDDGGVIIDARNAGVILDGSALPFQNGLHIASDGNVIQGLQILRFPSHGLLLDNQASGNLIGGDSADERNVISGNGWGGVWIEGSGTVNNIVSGNYIGTDPSGTSVISNGVGGVVLAHGARYNLVGGENASPGGLCSGACNLISGNGRDPGSGGVVIRDADTMSNTVSGNYIGTDASGTSALGNMDGVVVILNASGNTVGGTTSAERNLISGNHWTGVALTGGSPGGQVVRGNWIGTDRSGTLALGNSWGGVSIYYTPDNVVEDNLVAGNDGEGVSIMGSEASDNVVWGNFVGTDVYGTAAVPNVWAGVLISAGAHDNLVGGQNGSPGGGCSAGCNLISGNGNAGVLVTDGDTMSNTISGNYIGTGLNGQIALGNGQNGIRLADGTTNCTVGPGNLIAYNAQNGIQVRDPGTVHNPLSQNSIHSNSGLGIDLLAGGNGELPAPIITSYDLAAGTASGMACANCIVELFSDVQGEGRWFEGWTVAGTDGGWSVAKGSAFAGPELSATATDGAGNTSEFGQDWPADPPPAPVIASPVCGVTNQSQPLFSGLAQMGSTVRLGVAGESLGQTTADDENHWQLVAGGVLADAAHLVTATATTIWGTSTEAEMALTVDSTLCYDPVGVILSQAGSSQHPRDASGCTDPGQSLEVNLWPTLPVTVAVPAAVPTTTVSMEVNSVPYGLVDPDGDGVFTGSFAPPGSGNLVILLAVDCGSGPQIMQIGAIIDPDGYVYDAALTASTGLTQTIAGVTVTLYVSDTVRHKWLPWSAALYAQINPQVTGDDGYFAFFTPPGGYRLVAEGQHLGYEDYESPLLAVVDEPVRYNVPLRTPGWWIYLPLIIRN